MTPNDVAIGADGDRSRSAGPIVANHVVDGPSMDGLRQSGSVVFYPHSLPYDPARESLYTVAELFDGFDADDPCSYCHTTDAKIYRHWAKTGKARPPREEAIVRCLHDNQISGALDTWLDGRRVVGVMGGHEMSRSDSRYGLVARLTRSLSRKGYAIVTGGGPGAMEAAHLGAALSKAPDKSLREAVEVLKEAPTYKHREWLATAFRVRQTINEYDPGPVSVGIPTWLYGHEPPTPFASVIAKYFDNSLRQESLLTRAKSGVIFAPGSAGTVHEVFQHLVQNHYGTVDGRANAMIFMGTRFWVGDEAAPTNGNIEYRPVRNLVQNLSRDKPYASLIAYLDEPEEIIRWIEEHPPVTTAAGDWTFCSAHC